MELQKVGIYSTQTQGYDPTANGLAENAVAKIGAVARANLSRLASDVTDDTLRALWPFAMENASLALTLSCRPITEHRNHRDILPFGAMVLCRQPPMRDLGKTEMRAYEAMHLFPSESAPSGHMVAPLTGRDARHPLTSEVISDTTHVRKGRRCN